MAMFEKEAKERTGKVLIENKIKRENNIDKTKKELNDFFNTNEGKEKEQDESCPDCLCEDCDNYCISKELGLIKWAKRIIKYTVTLGGVWKEML